MRIKEQGTHLTLHEHDDDDDDFLSFICINSTTLLINTLCKNLAFLVFLELPRLCAVPSKCTIHLHIICVLCSIEGHRNEFPLLNAEFEIAVVKHRSQFAYWNSSDRQQQSGGPAVSNQKLFAPIVFCS